MPRKSTVVTKLPPDVRRSLDRKLMEGTLTLDQLLEFLAGCDGVEAMPSRSSLFRYSATFEATARAMRQSREMARSLAQDLGPESVEGEQGRVLVEMLRGLVFDVLMDMRGEPGKQVEVEKLQRLSRTLKEMSHSMHLEQDFAKRIRDEERKKALEEMKGKLDAAAASGGLDAATAQEARRVLGFSDG